MLVSQDYPHMQVLMVILVQKVHTVLKAKKVMLVNTEREAKKEHEEKTVQKD